MNIIKKKLKFFMWIANKRKMFTYLVVSGSSHIKTKQYSLAVEVTHRDKEGSLMFP